MADLNGDGIPDVVTANAQGGIVTVQLGTGDGTLQPTVNYPAGYRDCQTLVVGDFNGDHIPDLAVGSYDQNGHFEISVLLGNGDGFFQAPLTQAFSYGPFSLAVGDFNGDGKLDLVATGVQFGQGGTLTVLAGNGDGTFQSVFTASTGTSTATSVAVADFNGDGKPDLAVTRYGSFPEPPSVVLFFGNGDGTFQAGPQYTTGSNPVAVVAGDFNGDGRWDLATADQFSGVSVLLGNGNGTFQSSHDYAVPGGATGLVVADVNGDDHADLLTVSSGKGTVLLGDGHGSFQVASSADLGAGSAAIAVGDFNGDGQIDLATANKDSNDVSVRLGNGDGTFQTTPRYASPSTSADSLAVADFNGDSIPDIVTANSIAGTVSVQLGNGDGTFQAPVSYNTEGAGSASVIVEDLNGDGIPDLVVARSGYVNPFHQHFPGSIDVFLGNGDGTFRSGGTYGFDAYSVAVVDVTGDGVPDVVALVRVGPNFTDPALAVLQGNGDGTFQPANQTDLGSTPLSLAVGDVNNDGKPDVILVAYPTGPHVSVLLGNGDGTFQTPGTYNIPGNPNFGLVSDLNGDNNPDLIVTTTNGVTVLFGNGDGSFQDARNYSVFGTPKAVAVADFNGDGSADLAVEVASGVRVLLGDGVGDFQDGRITYGSVPGSGVGVGDFNGDNFPDVATGGGLLLLNAADWPANQIHSPRTAHRRSNAPGADPASAMADFALAGGAATTFSAPSPSPAGAEMSSTGSIMERLPAADLDRLFAGASAGIPSQPAWLTPTGTPVETQSDVGILGWEAVFSLGLEETHTRLQTA